MRDQDVVLHLNRAWSGLALDQVFALSFGKFTYVCLASELNGLRILHAVCVGPRGGCTEDVVIVDTTASNPQQQLVANKVFAPRGPGLIDLHTHSHGGREELINGCHAALQGLLLEIKARPQPYINTVKRRRSMRAHPTRGLRDGLPLIPRPVN